MPRGAASLADRVAPADRRSRELPDGVEQRVVVVVPTYDEALNIETVLLAARRALPSATILVVDDNSPDGTADIAAKVAHEAGGIEVLRRPAKEGLGVAYRAGFAWALDHGAEVVVEMDADGSHDAGDLRALVAPVAFGADVAIGSRYVPGGRISNWAGRRRALSRWGNRYVAFALGLALNDATSGFRAYHAGILRALDVPSVRADGYGFQIEMAYRAVRLGASVVEVPIVFSERSLGDSKMSPRIVAEAFALVTGWGARDVLRGRRRSR